MVHVRAENGRDGPDSSPTFQTLQERLRLSAYGPLRRLTCAQEDGRFVLRGTVPSYYLRQVADALAASVVGEDRLQSEIEVQPADALAAMAPTSR